MGSNGPTARVLALSAALAVVAVLAQVAWLILGPPARDVDLRLLVTLALLFALAERFTVTFPVRRGAHVLSLSEIPLVLSLVMIPPVLLAPVRLVGALAGLILFRRQRGSKLAFNTALYLTQVTVAGVLFHLISGVGDPFGPLGWLGAYAATFAADLVSIVLITAVIALHDDGQEWGRLLTADVKQLFQLPLVAVTTSLALVTALLVREHWYAALLLGVLAFAAHRAFRRYAQQTRTHQQVEDLYRFTRSLDGLAGAEEVARTVLDQVRDLVRAEEATLVVPATDDGRPIRLRLHGRNEFTVEPLTDDDGAWWQPAVSGTPVLLPASIAAPVRLGGSTGALLADGCMPDTPAFTAEHAELLQAMSAHAGAAFSEARLLQRLQHTSTHDPLTDLPNRDCFLADLQKTTDDVRPGSVIGVLLLDLDRFKDVNDALGHDIGDDLLRQIGRRLLDRFGHHGTVSRFGADEFALIIGGAAGLPDVLAVAEDVRRTVELPGTVGDLTLVAQVSIGVSVAPEHGTDANRLLRRADLALHAAKEARCGVRFYQPDDDRDTARRLMLMTGLHTAVDDAALTVVYQPKVDPGTGRVLGAEALTRWTYDGRPVPPDEFIPLAERSGLIRPLTTQVLDTALAECALWRASGHELSIAVNLSPSLLVDAGLTGRVEDALRRHGLPAHALTLELTENGIMADPANARRTLDELHTLGVRLSIDDFGTGHSSLGRLAHLPIHEVKIDKSFIRHIDTDRNRRAVTDAALQLAGALDLTVVAEGVEEPAELDHLRRHGCHAVQGYLISRPLPAAAFRDWLTATAPRSPALPGATA